MDTHFSVEIRRAKLRSTVMFLREKGKINGGKTTILSMDFALSV
jgi:hypothetical protein